jgi:Concanavalin A-like lectin/glucanases superfamily
VRILLIAACTLFAASCGRLQFDPAARDANVDGPSADAVDAPVDSIFGSLAVGLVVRFPMDDNPRDGSKTITAIPAQFSAPCVDVAAPTCPSAAMGMLGTGGYHFDGTFRTVLGDFVSAAPYSVALWIKPANTGGTVSPIGKEIDDATSLNEMAIRLSPTAVAFEGAVGGAVEDVTATINIIGAWHHVIVTWDGVDRILYIDGAEAARGTGAWMYSARPVGIGGDKDFGNLNLPYSGDMDDVRFYNRPLSTIEAALLFALR